MRRLARAGIPILSYSFMWGETFRDYLMNSLARRPLFDWVRTDLSVPWRDGSTALALDMVAQWITIQKSVLIVQVSISFFFHGFFIKTKIEGEGILKRESKAFWRVIILSHTGTAQQPQICQKLPFIEKEQTFLQKDNFPFCPNPLSLLAGCAPNWDWRKEESKGF